MKYVFNMINEKNMEVDAPGSGYATCMVGFINDPDIGHGVLLESPADPISFVETEAENFEELKTEKRAYKKVIEKIKKYFNEQGTGVFEACVNAYNKTPGEIKETVHVFQDRKTAEEAAQSVNHYLKEQEMYLEVSVIGVENGYAVAVVSCY